MSRVIGDFKKYRGFGGSIEITDAGNLKGVVCGSKPAYEYFATNIECLEDAFHKAVDDYMLNSLFYRDIKCSSDLLKSCSLNCEECICRECEERTHCKDGNNSFGCGK